MVQRTNAQVLRFQSSWLSQCFSNRKEGSTIFFLHFCSGFHSFLKGDLYCSYHRRQNFPKWSLEGMKMLSNAINQTVVQPHCSPAVWAGRTCNLRASFFSSVKWAIMSFSTFKGSCEDKIRQSNKCRKHLIAWYVWSLTKYHCLLFAHSHNVFAWVSLSFLIYIMELLIEQWYWYNVGVNMF